MFMFPCNEQRPSEWIKMFVAVLSSCIMKRHKQEFIKICIPKTLLFVKPESDLVLQKSSDFRDPSCLLLVFSSLETLTRLCWWSSSSRHLHRHKSSSAHSSGPRLGPRSRPQYSAYCWESTQWHLVHKSGTARSSQATSERLARSGCVKNQAFECFETYSFSLDCFSTFVKQSHFFVVCFLHMTRTMSVFSCWREKTQTQVHKKIDLHLFCVHSM